MTNQQAQEQAARMGLSVWQEEVIELGEKSGPAMLKCVGFASVGLPVSEAETWEDALSGATRIIFSA